MPEHRPGTPSCPTRRDVLAAGARFGTVALVSALVSAPLAACGIRLEGDARRGGGAPERRPLRGEPFLLALRRHSLDLAAEATALGGPAKALPARLAVLHTRQAEVLRTELLRLGVPVSVVDGAEEPDGTATTTSPSAGPSSGPSSTQSPGASSGATAGAVTGPQALAASEAGDLGPAAITDLAGVPAEVLPLAGALLAQRAAAAALLGTPTTWPEPKWSEPSLAASYLQSTRAAVYGFQVVAAQSPTGAQRTLARTTLAVLEARQGRQEALAGPAAAPPPLAYPLPYPVATPAAARKLAAHLLTELLATGARDLGSTGGEAGPLGAVVQWLADTEVLASRWGVALTPFPGLVAPA
ncbi:DUF4439 domain-containing protein [Phycicoccus sp. Soil748]|uniref:DUF4439 domain-containing protein n=1 Tax=Phycicoccus sp. Soil748 TaxID=1736397 RepID=UPI000702FFE1|nr:DUF4439 domain-containing protein [Phycicoccus sp. Soil748]KRE55273.1 hypothetical protein ASG70_07695 [Phycicoccus sp. Soil748]